MVCGGASGWLLDTWQGERSSTTGTPLFIADGEGKAQGVSIERGLHVQDILGRTIIVQEVGNAQSKWTQSEEQALVEEFIWKRQPALGVIGWQC